ncbi:selenocysteine-specific translation elongation factor [Shewanella sp. NFH-SH190041]|uniref:selenocysteine-specific translation elongation factor n=1 Tax=Shewanella sp. NFH-SH190041 TaxID=2950245 RepID=UPI0021C3AF39|nr:selenocysteine-specific translation elongation factor [Shewanella sp. NFH-SH190041]BDM63215.1 selenocysteine-specific translation elongation factor [Shewanella sp. NFH-SH190041]
MIIVTAGHVDHGKTSLIRALTGTDADRLPEEQRRGMTIDLGYAFMDINQGQRLAFIDVPGHEKFINNMLCGVSHARHAMLVVACDDGVMPQTREHLQILTLMPLQTLTLVLTKCDRVADSQIATVQREVMQYLAQCAGLKGVACYPLVVSAHSGQGMAALSQHLQSLATAKQACDQAVLASGFRMVLDRVFTVKGAGLVATGTVISGAVALEDKLHCSGQNNLLRVRGLHAQGRKVSRAVAGERVALNLTGNSRPLSRGDWLSSSAEPIATDRISVLLRGFTPTHWQSVHLHHGASHCLGRIALLTELTELPAADGVLEESANLALASLAGADQAALYLAELVLEQPLVPVAGDMLVVRDACGRHTLGGAQVLELSVPSRGKRNTARLAYLTSLAHCVFAANTLMNDAVAQIPSPSAAQTSELQTNRLQTILLRCGYQAQSVAQLSWDYQLSASAMATLSASGQLVSRGGWLVTAERLTELQQVIVARLDAFHQHSPDELGVGRARLMRMCHCNLPTPLISAAIDGLVIAGSLATTRGLLHLPQHALALNDTEQQLWQQLQPQFVQSRGMLWTTDICTALTLEPKAARQLSYKLVQLGYISAVIKDRYLLTDTLQQGATLLLCHFAKHSEISTSEFCQAMAMGRKAGIQLLEYFDRSGFTRRLHRASQRSLRDGELFAHLRDEGTDTKHTVAMMAKNELTQRPAQSGAYTSCLSANQFSASQCSAAERQ